MKENIKLVLVGLLASVAIGSVVWAYSGGAKIVVENWSGNYVDSSGESGLSLGAGSGESTVFTRLTVTDTFDVTSTVTMSGAVNVGGDLRADLVDVGTVTTFTATTTITAAQLCDSSVWIVSPVTSTPTLTLPNANLVAADCLSQAGDTKTLAIFNYSLVTNTRFAAGTSSTINWSISTSSVNPSNSAILTAFRTSTTGGYEVQLDVAAN